MNVAVPKSATLNMAKGAGGAPRIAVSGTAMSRPAPPGVNIQSSEAATTRIEALLRFEAGIRASADRNALIFFAVNEIATLLPARQALFLQLRTGIWRTRPRITHASAVATIDKTAPLIRTLESRAASAIASAVGNEQPPVPLDLSAIELDGGAYAFRHGLLLPLCRPATEPVAWLLLAAEKPWSEPDLIVGARLASALGHGLDVFAGTKRPLRARRMSGRPLLAACAVAIVASLFFPVPLTVLSPAEIVARDAAAITAPLDGVIRTIAVEPNTLVKPGDILFEFVDTGLRGEFDVASRAADVAAARYQRARQGAFASPELRGEIAIAQAEMTADGARRDLAAARLERAVVRAPEAGIAIFNRKDEWEGKPVSTGEWIMQIADPAKVELRVELAIGDTAALEGDGAIRVFFDSDPLNPVNARIVSSGYLAEPTAAQGLAYPVRASLDTGASATPPRIGSRGTAQVFGKRVTLFYYLLRRPISAIRQRIGL